MGSLYLFVFRCLVPCSVVSALVVVTLSKQIDLYVGPAVVASVGVWDKIDLFRAHSPDLNSSRRLRLRHARGTLEDPQNATRINLEILTHTLHCTGKKEIWTVAFVDTNIFLK